MLKVNAKAKCRSKMEVEEKETSNRTQKNWVRYRPNFDQLSNGYHETFIGNHSKYLKRIGWKANNFSYNSRVNVGASCQNIHEEKIDDKSRGRHRHFVSKQCHVTLQHEIEQRRGEEHRAYM